MCENGKRKEIVVKSYGIFSDGNGRVATIKYSSHDGLQFAEHYINVKKVRNIK